MNTITKQWLQQKISGMEATRDEIPFGLGEDDSNTLAALRIALASLEAEAVAYVDPFAFHNFNVYRAGETDNKRMGREWMWANPDTGLIPVFTAPPAPANSAPVACLWSHRKHASEVTLVRPEDDEKAEPGLWSGWSCQALYAAPPAPVSVPDYPETLPCPVMLEPGLRFGKGVKTITVLEALKRRAEYHAELEAMTPEQRAKHDAGMKEFAAMLQGAERVTTANKLPDGWVACSERMPEIGLKVLCFPVNDEPIHATYNGQVWLQDISWSTSDEPIDNVISCNVFHWMPLPAAPQQEAE